MNKLLLLLICFLTIGPAYANDFCTRSQSDIKHLLSDYSSRISFKNTGGLFNGGVCWWHSRLQRSSVYLARFAPDRPKPSSGEVKKIISSLRRMDKIVLIPGYNDFESFSRDFRLEIQKMLNDWQKADGFFNLQWIRGISGHSSLPPLEMNQRMNTVYKQFKSSPLPVWIMAQVKGITSHSLLIVEMKKKKNGYSLEVIDSNYPQRDISIDFYSGDTSLRASGENYSFVPYVGFQNDFTKISQALKKTCGAFNLTSDFENIPQGEIEID
jgi:hypothetical protein